MSSSKSPSSTPTTPPSFHESRRVTGSEEETVNNLRSSDRVEEEGTGQSLQVVTGLLPSPSTEPHSTAQLHHHHLQHHQQQQHQQSLSSPFFVQAPSSSGDDSNNNSNNEGNHPYRHSPPPPSPFAAQLHSQQNQQMQIQSGNVIAFSQNQYAQPHSSHSNGSGHHDPYHPYQGHPEAPFGGIAAHGFQQQPLFSPVSPTEYEHRNAHYQQPIGYPSSYYSPLYQQVHSMPASPTTKDHRYQYNHQPGPPHSAGGKRPNGYHPYYVQHHPQQQLQQQQQQQQQHLIPSPGQESFRGSASTIKASSIFSPSANMMQDVLCVGQEGTGANYGRLPNGNIIELYPAMMRTIQACEYCRSRKAKCSGGLPCERCEKKGVKCEYAQLDKKRKIKTTTSEYDMSGGSAANTAGASKGAGNHASNANTAGGGDPSMNNSSFGRDRVVKKGTRSAYREAGQLENVLLDLSSSPFTPVSLLYQQEQGPSTTDQVSVSLYNPAVPMSEPLLRPGFSQLSAFYTHYNKELKVPIPSQPSPTSSASYGSTEYNGLAPEATSSPMPNFSFQQQLMRRDGWSGEEEEHAAAAASGAPQETAFRRGNVAFNHTSFY